METYFMRGPDPRAYLTHDDAEFVGHTPDDALTPDISVENARKTIHKLLVEDRRRMRSGALPDLAPQVPCDFMELQPNRKWGREDVGRVERLRKEIQRLCGIRLDIRHLFWPITFVLVLWQPAAVLAALFVAFWLVLLGHMIFGVSRMERVRTLAMGLLPSRWQP